MRNLTIKREKSFVACLMKVKVYIEDPTSNEITINDIPCRKLGDLKNGETKTFQIGDQGAKIFVIADKLSKNYCNDYYQLLDGQEDIYLTGKNKFNPANGNAFRFDNNPTIGIAESRKRGTRTGLLILIAAVIVGAVVGFAFTSGLFLGDKEKTFSSNGMTITLTDSFWETKMANYTVTYDSKNVAVFALQEKFSLVDGFEKYTLKEYADLVIKANELDSVKPKTDDGLTYFEYDFYNSEAKETYRYYAYVYKTDDAFWLVQFAVSDKDSDKYAQKIVQWAKSVEFSK